MEGKISLYVYRRGLVLHSVALYRSAKKEGEKIEKRERKNFSYARQRPHFDTNANFLSRRGREAAVTAAFVEFFHLRRRRRREKEKDKKKRETSHSRFSRRIGALSLFLLDRIDQIEKAWWSI